jgi:hypothetical protein
MSRDINALVLAELEKPQVKVALFAEIETDAGFVRAFAGIGDITIDGKLWRGTGIDGKVSTVEETTDGRAAGLVYELSGIPEQLVSDSLQAIRHKYLATLYMGVFDEQNRLIGELTPFDRGLTDVPELTDDGQTATIRISTEKRSVDQQRPRVRRYTPEDQRIDDPTDKGFDYVAGLQDAKIQWGRA